MIANVESFLVINETPESVVDSLDLLHRPKPEIVGFIPPLQEGGSWISAR